MSSGSSKYGCSKKVSSLVNSSLAEFQTCSCVHSVNIFTYKLSYSVLVHCGGVHGGHYYAFCRPGDGKQWYESCCGYDSCNVIEYVDGLLYIYVDKEVLGDVAGWWVGVGWWVGIGNKQAGIGRWEGR